MYVKTFFKIQNMHNNTLCSVTQYKTTAHTKARENTTDGIQIISNHALLWNAKYF